MQCFVLTSWLLGLVVWFSLRAREVPGSVPGAALYINSWLARCLEGKQRIARWTYLESMWLFQCRTCRESKQLTMI